MGQAMLYFPANANNKTPIQPMKKKMIVGRTILMLAAMSAVRAESADNDLRYAAGEYYQSEELSMDAFGTLSLGKYTIDHLSSSRVRHNARLGAGLGISYFFTRNIGVGADAYSEGTDGPVVDSLSGNLILRLPLGQSGFAPYAFGGGGHQFDLAKVWFFQLGAGMEYRFAPQVGAFVDARWVLPEETKYFGVARFGVRFVF
jgi:hypothetical protein